MALCFVGVLPAVASAAVGGLAQKPGADGAVPVNGAYELALLVTAALVLLERDGMVLAATGSTRAWKITAAGRLMLPPRRGPARRRRGVGGGPTVR